MKKLICECCGAPINAKTLKCEYCGTQYKEENEKIVKFETFKNPVDGYEFGMEVDSSIVEYLGENEAGKFIAEKLANGLAKAIAPNMKIEVYPNPLHNQYHVRSQVRVVRPEESGFRW